MSLSLPKRTILTTTPTNHQPPVPSESVESAALLNDQSDEALDEPPDQETQRFEITDVVVTPDAIRSLATLINESIAPLYFRRAWRKTFTFEFEDGSQRVASSMSVFTHGNVLDTKQISQITLNVSNQENDVITYIEVVLTHGERNAVHNRVTIGGSNSTWVNGVMRRFENMIHSWEPQFIWVRRLWWVLCIVLTIVLGRLCMAGMLFTLQLLHAPLIPQSPDLAGLALAVVWMVGCLVGAGPALVMTRKLRALWPSIELRTGPLHVQAERRKRKLLAAILSLVVVPLLVAVVYDFIKGIWQ